MTKSALRMTSGGLKLFRPWDTAAVPPSSSSCSTISSSSSSSSSSTFTDKKAAIRESAPRQHSTTVVELQECALPLQSPYQEVCPRTSCWSSCEDLGLAAVAVDHAYWASLAAKYYETATESKTKVRPKKYRCPYCHVAFSNNGQLKGHVRIHTGERPFKCDTEGCGKSFTRNEELTRHKRIHTGLRPYGCSSCGKKFGRKDHLKKHARTHLPVLPHPAYVFYPYVYGF